MDRGQMFLHSVSPSLRCGLAILTMAYIAKAQLTQSTFSKSSFSGDVCRNPM